MAKNKTQAKSKASAKEELTQKAKALKEQAKGPMMLSADGAKKIEKVKKSKKAKKQNEDDSDDALLSDEVEPSGEDLPDLAEFDENETEAPAEAADSDSDLNGSGESMPQEEEEIFLTDAEGRRLCRVRDCDQAATVEAYCRYHYLLNWKRIQVRRKILADGKLERYVDELTGRYPDKFLEMIRKDVRAEKDFLVAIAELEIDESGLDNEFEEENTNFIEEVRGVTESSGMSDEEEF